MVCPKIKISKLARALKCAIDLHKNGIKDSKVSYSKFFGKLKIGEYPQISHMDIKWDDDPLYPDRIIGDYHFDGIADNDKEELDEKLKNGELEETGRTYDFCVEDSGWTLRIFHENSEENLITHKEYIYKGKRYVKLDEAEARPGSWIEVKPMEWHYYDGYFDKELDEFFLFDDMKNNEKDFEKTNIPTIINKYMLKDLLQPREKDKQKEWEREFREATAEAERKKTRRNK